MGTVTPQELINTRAGTHGEYSENSAATWDMMRILMGQSNWPILDDTKRHACYMIVHKLSRILAGNPNEPDHWNDIAGYATLASDRCTEPVYPLDITKDVFAALAVAWNISRREAVVRFAKIAESKRDQDLDKAIVEAINLEEPAPESDMPEFMKKWSEPPEANILGGDGNRA